MKRCVVSIKKANDAKIYAENIQIYCDSLSEKYESYFKCNYILCIFISRKAKDLIKNLRPDPLPLPEFNPKTLIFGSFNSDHMISIDYHIKSGWTQPVLDSFQNISIHPFSPSLHYGIQCFEGTKAYKNSKG